MKYQKKAVDLTDLAIGIIVLAVVVSVGANILLTTRNARLTDLDVITTTNESITVTDTGVDFANTWVQGLTSCTNGTTATVINSGNYTTSISSVDGVMNITNLTGEYPHNAWRCTYDWYNTSRPDYAVADDAATGLAEYGNWFTIIVIVGVAAVVLSLIFMAFGRGSSGGTVTGGSY